jgi:hypothetical protein
MCYLSALEQTRITVILETPAASCFAQRFSVDQAQGTYQFMFLRISHPAPVFPSAFALLIPLTDDVDDLRNLSGNSGQHIQQHSIYGLQHASGKVITYCIDSARWLVGRSRLTMASCLSVICFLSVSQPASSRRVSFVDLFNEDHITRFRHHQEA